MPQTGPSSPDHRLARIGLANGVLAYLTWGLNALYFKQVTRVSPVIVLAHRVVWSVLFIALLLAGRHAWSEVRAACRSRRVMLTLAASTVLLATNWFVYIYSISVNQLLQDSLGYFMLPLLSVALGVVFFKERLRPWQLVGLVLAATALAILTVKVGHFPWIGITVAFSFGFYGLLRKTVAAGSLVGLAVETALLLPIALALIVHDILRGQPHTTAEWLWLPAAGVVTAVPLLWFAVAVRRLRLSTLGFLQYLTPTGQFLLAVFVYREPFVHAHLVSFCLIWVALAIYSIDSLRAYRASLAVAEPEALADV